MVSSETHLLKVLTDATPACRQAGIFTDFFCVYPWNLWEPNLLPAKDESFRGDYSPRPSVPLGTGGHW